MSEKYYQSEETTENILVEHAESNPDIESEHNINNDGLTSASDCDDDEPHLERSLTFWDGIGVLVGIMIGSGIFASAGTALDEAGSCGIAVSAWVCAAVLVTIASFCYCELGASVPNAGGDAEYLRLAFGQRVAFVFVWTNLWVLKPGSQAIIATIFGEYLERAFTGGGDVEQDGWIAKGLAIGALCLLAWSNCMGIRQTSNVQNVLTGLKGLMIAALVVAGLGATADSPKMLKRNIQDGNENDTILTSLIGFGRAVVPCLWAFDGWADLGSLAEDLVNPEKYLPLIILSSIGLVTSLYLLCNMAYFAVLSRDDIIDSDAVAIEFSNQLGGGMTGKILIALGVAVSTLGSCNGSILTGGRLFFAVSRTNEGHPALLPPFFNKLNKRGAPVRALLAQLIWGVILLLLPGSSFSSLLDYFGPVSWFFYALTASTTIALRQQQPDLPRPFTMPFYPVPPIVVCLLATCIIVATIAASPLYCSIAVGFVLLGFPVYDFTHKPKAEGHSSHSALLDGSERKSETGGTAY